MYTGNPSFDINFAMSLGNRHSVYFTVPRSDVTDPLRSCVPVTNPFKDKECLQIAF